MRFLGSADQKVIRIPALISFSVFSFVSAFRLFQCRQTASGDNNNTKTQTRERERALRRADGEAYRIARVFSTLTLWFH